GFRTFESPLRIRRPRTRVSLRCEKDRGDLRHVSVAAAGSFWRTVLLPTADQRLFDVGHRSAHSALHEIVCLSSSGSSPRSGRCAAYLLWLWGHRRCAPPRTER